eukprot:3261541-Karenia_brevis.AAC.1
MKQKAYFTSLDNHDVSITISSDNLAGKRMMESNDPMAAVKQSITNAMVALRALPRMRHPSHTV